MSSRQESWLEWWISGVMLLLLWGVLPSVAFITHDQLHNIYSPYLICGLVTYAVNPGRFVYFWRIDSTKRKLYDIFLWPASLVVATITWGLRGLCRLLGIGKK